MGEPIAHFLSGVEAITSIFSFPALRCTFMVSLPERFLRLALIYRKVQEKSYYI